MRFVLPAAAALACAACSTSSTTTEQTSPTTCSIPQPSPSTFRLVADGTTFRDALGRVVLLRGVNAGGRSKFAPYVPFDYPSGGFDAALDAYMERAQGWGIDAMRVPFVWAAVDPTEGADDEGFLEQYDAILDAAWAHGIWTVVDFHQDVYSESFCGDGFPAWTIPGTPPAPMHDCPDWSVEYFDDTDVIAAFDRFWAGGSSVQAAYRSLWTRLATRYADKPGVLGFELINEPSQGSASAVPFDATTLTYFYDAMVPVIQAAAPSSLVFVDPLGADGVALTTTLGRPAGSGVVFAPHFYPVIHTPDDVLMEMSESWAPVGQSWGAPVFVGEFGGSHDDPGMLAFMTAHFDALDALGLSGTEWEYSVSAEEWNDETDSLVAADGTEYPVAAAVQRPFARAIAGDVFTTNYDASTSIFSLSFEPGSNEATEVSLPAHAYPDGFDATITGGCVDTSHAGEVLVRADAGASVVALTLTPKSQSK